MVKRIVDTFTINIVGQPGAYLVQAKGSGGIYVAPQPFTWSPTPEQSAVLISLAEAGRVAPGVLQELGQSFHRALFVPLIAEAWGRAQAQAPEGGGVRLRLVVEPLELASLPWEALHDGVGYLSAQSDQPLVRALPGRNGTNKVKRLAVRGALRVLFVGASPEGLPALNLKQVAGDVRSRLGEAIRKKRVVLDVLLDATLEELRTMLLADYHVVYFAGHGTEDGIYLDDGQGGKRDETTGQRPVGDADRVTARELAAEFEGKATRLVFVAACDTGVTTGFAVELARLGEVPAVVGMQYQIGDGAAAELAGRFFESLGAMYAVDVALAEARKALLGETGGGRDAVAPVLYLQAEDGALFRRTRNWLAIGLGTALLMAVAVGLFALSWGLRSQERAQMEATDRAFAQATGAAQATERALEQERREVAETQQVVAEVTSAIRATERAYAQATAKAEAVVRATAEAEELAQSRRVLSRRLAAQALPEMEESPPRCLLLAVEAIRHTLDKDGITVTAAEQALRQGLGSVGGIPLVGHQDRVNSVVFSPDGNQLVTSSMDGETRVWDVSALYRGRMLDTPVTGVWIKPAVLLEEGRALAFSPDGRWLAFEGEDGIVRLMDANDPAKESVVLSGYEGDAGEIAFSPDGRWLAIADLEGPLRLWRISTSRETYAISLASTPATLSGYTGNLERLIFSPDGRWLVAASADGVWLWNTVQPTAGPVSLKGTENRIESIAFGPDGRSLLVANHEGLAQMWDLTDLTMAPQILHRHETSVAAATFSPDGRWLATGEQNDTNIARLWDLARPDSEPRVLRGHEGNIMGAAVGKLGGVVTLAFSPNSHLLATGSRDGTIRLWDVVDPAVEPFILHESEGDIWALAFSPDSQWLVTGGRNTKGGHEGLARLWNLADLADPVVLSGHEGGIWALSFTPGGQLVIAGGRHDTLGVWDVSMLPDVDVAELAVQSIALEPYENDIVALAFAPDARWLVDAASNTVWLREASALLDAIAGEPLAEPLALRAQENDIEAAAISPDGQWLATGSYDGTGWLWDLTDTVVGPIALPEHDMGIYALAFSPDGQWLATGSTDTAVRLWEISVLVDTNTMNAKTEPIMLRGYQSDVRAVAFSPDGRWLAAGGWDMTVWLWDMADLSAEPILLRGHTDGIETIAFSPDGRWLASGGWDKDTRLWHMDVHDLIQLACRTAGRNLTREEWQRFLPSQPYRKTCPDLPESTW